MAKKPLDRNAIIIRTSVIGIVANVCLSVLKAFIGIITNSIAITLDAVNNISDAASSVITIIGTKLANRLPDKKHPFGYGRVEYLSAMVISCIIFYAGARSFFESLEKIFIPEAVDYPTGALIVIGAAVIVKLLLGRYVRATGEKVDSDSLVNSGKEALFDSIISLSTLLAAGVYLIWRVSIEAYLGALISAFITKSGIEMLRDTISSLLGERADTETAATIKATVRSFPQVHGVYDLVLNDYGPNAYNASLHIEVDDNLSMNELDELSRDIAALVYEKHHVVLSAVGIYARNTKDAAIIEAKQRITSEVLKIEFVKQIHGFYISLTKKVIRFDVVVSFRSKDRLATFQAAVDAVQSLYPDFHVKAAMDTDFSEV